MKKSIDILDCLVFNLLITEPGILRHETDALKFKFLVNIIRSFVVDKPFLRPLYSTSMRYVDEVCNVLLVDVDLLLEEEERSSLCPSLNLLQLDTLLSVYYPSVTDLKYKEKVSKIQKFINSLIPQAYNTLTDLVLHFDVTEMAKVDTEMVSIVIPSKWSEISTDLTKFKKANVKPKFRPKR
ncbi:hypothetical protein GEMRC1_005696 [Eukaryota sp. GEM-RC1]